MLQQPFNAPLDLLFLGSGNAFAAEGRAFSSFLLNGRYLFDCGPTVLQQLRKANVSSHDIEVVFISHFHADHFFGLPFLLLDGHYSGRIRDLTIVGPPGIEAQTEQLIRLGYPGLKPNDPHTFKRRYVEVSDLFVSNIFELAICASRVDHVDEFPCFAYRVQIGGRSLVYSGDSDPVRRPDAPGARRRRHRAGVQHHGRAGAPQPVAAWRRSSAWHARTRRSSSRTSTAWSTPTTTTA